jgi:hypothetical protein
MHKIGLVEPRELPNLFQMVPLGAVKQCFSIRDLCSPIFPSNLLLVTPQLAWNISPLSSSTGKGKGLCNPCRWSSSFRNLVKGYWLRYAGCRKPVSLQNKVHNTLHGDSFSATGETHGRWRN